MGFRIFAVKRARMVDKSLILDLCCCGAAYATCDSVHPAMRNRRA